MLRFPFQQLGLKSLFLPVQCRRTAFQGTSGGEAPTFFCPCSLPHMLRCLPAPKSICSVNKLASLIARKLPPGQPIPGGVAPDLSPLRLNRDTSGKTERDPRAWCRQRAVVQAGPCGCQPSLPWVLDAAAGLRGWAAAGSQAEPGQVPAPFCG